MRVGFVTYDSKVHFYNLNKGLSQPQMMTVGDVGDMFVPLVEGFMVNADESEAVIDALMEQIPTMFGETRETETVLGPVIQAGKEAFKVRLYFCCFIDIGNNHTKTDYIFSRLPSVQASLLSSITICPLPRRRVN